MLTKESRTISGEMSYPLKLAAKRPLSSGVNVLLPSSSMLAARMCLYEEMRKPAVPQAGSKTVSSFLGSTDGHDEVDDVARRTELSGIALGAKHGEQIFVGVAKPLRMVVGEFIDNLQERTQGLRVAVR